MDVVFLKRIWAAPCLATGFCAGHGSGTGHSTGRQQTRGSGDLALQLQPHTPEPRTKNQTLVQWSDSADIMAAAVSHATEGMRSASTECGKGAGGKNFLKE